MNKRLVKKADGEVTDSMLKELAELEFNGRNYKKIDIDKVKEITDELNKLIKDIEEKTEEVTSIIRKNSKLFNDIMEYDCENLLGSYCDSISISDVYNWILDDVNISKEMQGFYKAYDYVNNNDVVNDIYQELKEEELSLDEYNRRKDFYKK